MPQIAIVGMGHLGKVMAASMVAHSDHPLICCEPFKKLNLSRDYGEPGLREALGAQAANILWTTDVQSIRSADIVYVTYDLSRYDWNLLSKLKEGIELLGTVMGSTAFMVLMSTVPPGFTRSIQGIDGPRLFYRLDNLVLGQALERGQHPNAVIIGKPLEEIHRRAHTNVPKKLRAHFELVAGSPDKVIYMSYESAELTKIAINCYLANSIALTNVLASIGDRVPHVDWADVRAGLAHDPRVGTYNKPGLGIGGGHLLRDVRAAQALAPDEKMLTNITNNSDYSIQWVDRKAWEIGIKSLTKMAVWGLAYKPNTSVVLESPGLRFLHLAESITVVHDPAVEEVDLGQWGVRVASPLEAVEDAELLLIATPWPQYQDIPLHSVAMAMSGRTILLDPYRVYDPREAVKRGFDYHTIGLGLHHRLNQLFNGRRQLEGQRRALKVNAARTDLD